MIQNMARKRATDLAVYILYTLLFIFFTIPIVWILSLSFKTAKEVFTPATLTSIIPKEPTLENYGTIFKHVKMPKYILNSTKMVISSVLGVLVVSSLAAYALSRWRLRRKNIIMIAILLFQMVSPIVIGIPLYWYYSRLGLLNNHWSLAMVYIAVRVPFGTFLLKGVFDAVPIELDEAAFIDGATKMQVLVRVMLPISVTGIASASIFISIAAWGQFVLPFFLLSKDSLYPVSVGILLTQSSYRDISTHLVATASVIGLLPAIVLILFLQKFILKALLAGALKG
jgi:multiple sugar transport system permease protein